MAYLKVIVLKKLKKNINKIFLFSILCIAVNISYAQKDPLPKGEQQFITKCKKIAAAIVNKDLNAINSFINTNTGLYAIYMPGARAGYLHLTKAMADTMSFSLSAEYGDSKFPLNPTIKFAKNIVYDCGSGWSKKGNFIETSNKNKPLTAIDNMWKKDAKENSYEFNEKSKKEYLRIKLIEKNIRKIVFTNIGCCGLVFYMSYLNNKWYLTIIDQAETSCDG